MRHLTLAIAAVTLLAPGISLAQPLGSPAAQDAPKAQGGGADAHFRHGVELYKETDYNAALAEFRRAYEIEPRFQVLYNIAEAYYQMQDYANALRTFEKYLESGGSQISPARREEVMKELERLRTRVAHLEISVNLPGVEVAVDDVPMGKSPFAAPLLVSAGRRRVTATKPGQPALIQMVEIAGGDQKKITFAVPLESEAPKKVVPVWPWAVTGGLAAGTIITGSLALAAKSDLDTKLKTFPSANADDIQSAHSKATALGAVTDVFLGTAVVMASISVYLTVSSPTPRKADHVGMTTETPRIRLSASPQSLMLTGTF